MTTPASLEIEIRNIYQDTFSFETLANKDAYWSNISVDNWRQHGYIKIDSRFYKIAIRHYNSGGETYMFIIQEAHVQSLITSSTGYELMDEDSYTYTNYIDPNTLLTNVGFATLYNFNGTTPPTVSDDTPNSSNDPSLQNLLVDSNHVSDGSTINLNAGTTSVSVVATPTNANANVVIVGNDNLIPGNNTLTITVTAEDGITQNIIIITLNVAGGGGGGDPICFLGSAPVLTPAGYRRIDSLRAGDLVRTADGRSVAIQRIKTMVAQPGPHADPFVIPAGRFGATAALPISPRHRVAVPGRGLVEARDIGGLARLPMRAAWTYYNLGMPNWETDNLVVGGVEVESLAPVERIRMTMAEFAAILTKKYGAEAGSKAVLDRVLATCRLGADGLVEAPVIRKARA